MTQSKSLHLQLLLAPPVFLVVGPVLPVLYFVRDGAIFPAALFFLFLGAFAVGAIPASIAGLVYSGLSYVIGKVLRGREWELVPSLFLGAIAGTVGMLCFQFTLIGKALPATNGLKELFALGVGSGAGCAAVMSGISAWLAREPKSAPLMVSLRQTAAVSELGELVGEHGACPCCATVIPMSMLECPRCKALFGPGSAWRPRPLAAKQMSEIKDALTGRSIGSPVASADQ